MCPPTHFVLILKFSVINPARTEGIRTSWGKGWKCPFQDGEVWWPVAAQGVPRRCCNNSPQCFVWKLSSLQSPNYPTGFRSLNEWEHLPPGGTSCLWCLHREELVWSQENWQKRALAPQRWKTETEALHGNWNKLHFINEWALEQLMPWIFHSWRTFRST